MKNNNTLTIIIAVVTFVLGLVAGCHIKKCPVIESSNTIIDTVYQGYPIIDTYRISKPVNIPYPVHVPGKVIRITDTVFRNVVKPTFTAEDTLRYQKNGNNIFVAISDKGNCDGIISRGSVFGGDFKERVITVNTTNTVIKPYPFMALYAGASASFSGRWKAFDVGPAVSVSFRQRHNIGYSYQLNTSTHNLTLQTRIK